MSEGTSVTRGVPGSVVPAALSASVLAPLNSTMIVVALPTMLEDLGASLTWGSWVVVSYLVAMAAVQPLGGSLGDRFGRPRMMRLGLVGFTLATLAAAVAPSVEILVVARTLQAVTGASAIPNGTAMVRAWLPTARQGRALGAIGAGVGLAAALGPPIGGVVTDALGWRWIFAVNLLVLLPGMVWAFRLPRTEPSEGAARFDVRGAGLVLVLLVAGTLAGTIWRVPGVSWPVAVGSGIVALAAGAALRVHVGRSPSPVLDFGLFRRPGFLASGLSVAFSNLAMYTVLLAVPVFLAQRAGWQAREIGWALAGMSVLMMIFGPIGGDWSDRRGRRAPAVTGALIAALGISPFVAIDAGWSWAWFVASLMVVGTGVGVASAAVQAAALQVAGRESAGQAAGLFSTMRYLGSITGTATMAAVLGAAPGDASFRVLFVVLVAAAVAAALASWRLPATVAPS
jgi:DHA2 family methylenomycin A resistance protein-like MFS transporter